MKTNQKTLSRDASLLAEWYLDHQRPLPWRISKDPYKIWISEVMLQQTTVAAVVPYYERFLKKFPALKDLAQAPLEEVMEMWSGLGYYSRCRNLHKAAQEIFKQKQFPCTAAELLELPGFGPYTSRAVSSLSFGESVGVLDGNVIRVLSRKYGMAVQWWKTSGRQELQNISDALVQNQDSSVVNQGLMELGATICSPQNPSCRICPWSRGCVAQSENQVSSLPLSQPKRKNEYWIWQPEVILKKDEMIFIENDYAPFLRGQWLFPGEASVASEKPKKFDIKHGITHHDIFIQVKVKKVKSNHKAQTGARWVRKQDIKKINPTSLVQKVIQYVEKDLE